MGIKHFFGWFSKQFAEFIYDINPGDTVSDIPDKEIVIDNLMLDMNGIIHTAAQKIYKYGNYKPQTRLLGRPGCVSSVRHPAELKEATFNEVCLLVEKLLYVCKPTKRLIMCIDGVAPISKQNQQRQRRFRSAMEADKAGRKPNQFDQNSITPGTKFFDELSRYIDWYIRKKISECDIWQNFLVIFSNEKVPQEGEHKIANLPFNI
jgi:5'-3' exonuclease